MTGGIQRLRLKPVHHAGWDLAEAVASCQRAGIDQLEGLSRGGGVVLSRGPGSRAERSGLRGKLRLPRHRFQRYVWTERDISHLRGLSCVRLHDEFPDHTVESFGCEKTAQPAVGDEFPRRGGTPRLDECPTTDDVRTLIEPLAHVSGVTAVVTADTDGSKPSERVLHVPPLDGAPADVRDPTVVAHSTAVALTPAEVCGRVNVPTEEILHVPAWLQIVQSGDTETSGVEPYALAGLSGSEEVARSIDHLEPPTRHVLRTLAAMAGGGTLEAIAAVAGGGLAEDAVIDALSLLVGLRLASAVPGSRRYALTSRGTDYVRRQGPRDLRADGFARRHAEFFADQARAFGRRGHGAGTASAWLLDHPNRLRALATLRATGDWQRALRLAVDSMIGFVDRGELDAGRGALQEVLSEAAETTSRACIQAHVWLGRLEAERADGVHTTAARAHFDAALRLARERADVSIHLEVLDALCENQFLLEDGVRLCEEAVAEGLALPDAPEFELGRSALLAWHAGNLHRRGRLEEAAATIGQAIEVARRHGDRRLMMTVAIVYWQLPREVRREHVEVPTLAELLEMADAQGDLRTKARAWVVEVGDRVEQRDDRRAITGCLVLLRFARRTANQPVARQALVSAIRLLGRHPSPALIARLSGALATHGDAVTAQLPPRWIADLQRSVAAARRELSETEFRDARREGLAAGQWAVLDLAEERLSALLDEMLLESFDGACPVPGRLAVLTPRERQVLDALAAGGSNKEIAAQLGMRPKTVAHHCATIYTKLGVRNRTAAVAQAVRYGVGGASDA